MDKRKDSDGESEISKKSRVSNRRIKKPNRYGDNVEDTLNELNNREIQEYTEEEKEESSKEDQEQEEEEEEINYEGLFREIRDRLRTMLSDEKTRLSKTIKAEIKEIPQILKNIQQHIVNQEEKITQLETLNKKGETRINDLKDTIKQGRPTTQALRQAVTAALQQHTEELEDATNRMHEMIRKIESTKITTQKKNNSNTEEEESQEETESTTKTDEDSTPEEAPRKKKIVSNSPRSENKEEQNTPAYRRTIIIKSVGTKQMTGPEVKSFIDEQRPAVPAKSIERIYVRRRFVEVKCSTPAAATALQRSLQQHQTLNKSLAILKKPAPLQKMIILGVQQGYEEKQIETILASNYALKPEEIKVIGKRNSRNQTTEHWVLLLPIPISQQIIQDGGIRLGFQRCHLRPFTSVQRCRKCQSLSHTTLQCKSTQVICETCGGKHASEGCTNRPHCINCSYSNTHIHTNHSTNHKASDPTCNVYRIAYSEQRNRLDNIFSPVQQQNHPQHLLPGPSNYAYQAPPPWYFGGPPPHGY